MLKCLDNWTGFVAGAVVDYDQLIMASSRIEEVDESGDRLSNSRLLVVGWDHN
jgi:hypothetical protein